jgi:hypothetical protein
VNVAPDPNAAVTSPDAPLDELGAELLEPPEPQAASRPATATAAAAQAAVRPRHRVILVATQSLSGIKRRAIADTSLIKKIRFPAIESLDRLSVKMVTLRINDRKVILWRNLLL